MKLEFNHFKAFEFTNPLEGREADKLKRSLLTLMIRQKDKLFQGSHDPSGAPWKALSSARAAQQNKKSKKSLSDIMTLQKSNKNFKMHKILEDTGTLMKSIATDEGNGDSIRLITDKEVMLGTNVPYAAIQNFGGRIQNPGTDNGFGRGIKIEPHIVIIPARPFIGFGSEDNEQIKKKIAAVVRKIQVKK